MKTTSVVDPGAGARVNHADLIAALEQLASHAVREVFKTMLQLETQARTLDVAAERGGEYVASSVKFFGKISGAVHLHTVGPLAELLTRRILALNQHEACGSELVHDAMGELTNMVVGHIKTRFSDRGIPCALTVPRVVRGGLSATPGASDAQRLFAVTCAGNPLIIEIVLIPTSTRTTP